MVHGRHCSTSCKDEPQTMHHYDYSDVKCPHYTELVWCTCTAAFESNVHHACAVYISLGEAMGLWGHNKDWALLV